VPPDGTAGVELTPQGGFERIGSARGKTVPDPNRAHTTEQVFSSLCRAKNSFRLEWLK
jgi:hypothetical protein